MPTEKGKLVLSRRSSEMFMRIRAMFMAGLLAFAGAAVAAPQVAHAAGIKKLTTVPLGKYFPFAGMSVRVDKVETVERGDGRKILDRISGGFDRAKGYILITLSVQNPSDSDDIDMPSTQVGFELADGTQIDEAGPAGSFIAASLKDAPNSLHPKQHVQIVYALTEWNGEAPTKMFFHVNGGTAGNDAGYQYVRLQFPKDYVKVLAPQ
jgi:hypothetical protein